MNPFSRSLIFRLFFLCGIAGLCGWVLSLDQYWATKLFVILLFAGMIAEIVHHARNPQQRITTFMESLPISGDLPSLRLQTEDDLEVIFRRLVEIIRQMRIQKQAEYEVFVAATNHLAVAMLVFDFNGNIKLCNKALLQLLRMPKLHTIRQIAMISQELSDALLRIQPGEQLLLKIVLAGRPVKLSLRVTKIQLSDVSWNIATIQDIQQEIVQEETEAWQKIIRILTHEIINSTSPINMLTGSLEKIAGKDNWTEEDRQNMIISLQTIGKRSRGLTSFVESYRATTSIPEPVFSPVDTGNLLQHIKTLFVEEAVAKNIEIIVVISGKIIIQTDERLLEQVFINLLRNAIEAADKPHATIEMKARYDEQELLLEVSDNGCGITSENLESVFTPFFSTKKSGTGVGLFISRKIIHSLRGTLTVQSIHKQRTVFSIRLPKYLF